MTDPSVRRVPDADLGSIFSNRTEGLGGLAPRRPRTSPAPATTPAATATDPAGSGVDPGPAPSASEPAATVDSPQPAPPQTKSGGGAAPHKTATTQRPRRSTSPAGEAVVPRLVILQLPNAIADQLRDHARQRGVTYKELTLDAVEATADHLPDLLAAQRPQARSTGLFAGERVATQARPEGRRQVSIKLTEASIAALDELAAQHGARSRSELVATALAEYLSK